MPMTIDELLVDVTPPTAAAPSETAAATNEAARVRELDALLAERARVWARLLAD